MSAPSIGVLQPSELRARLDDGVDWVLLDVRESFELAIASIDGVVHVPLGELTARVEELDPERPTVCICHHGVRSAQAAGYLAARCGFGEVYNLAGGVDRWSQEVDPAMPRY